MPSWCKHCGNHTRGKLFCQNRGCEGYFRKVMIK